MSKQKSNNNNINKEELTNPIKCNDSKLINLSNELTDKEQLLSIENENNEEENKELNINSQQNGIDILKQRLKDDKYNISKSNNKQNLENTLNTYIIANKSKEQKILELLEIINQYEIQISKFNKQIISLTNSNKQMKNIIKTIEFDYEQTKINLMTERELNKNNNIYMNNLYQDKILTEERIKELINIINKYSTQTDSLTKTLNNLKNENINFKKENEEFQKNILELKEKNNVLEMIIKIIIQII